MKAIISDLDGLLIDSETRVWPEVISEFLASKGITNNDDVRIKTKGSGMRGTIEVFKRDLGLKGDTGELVSEIRNRFFKIIMQNPFLVDGVPEFLEKVDRKNFILAVATGSGPRDKVIELLVKLNIKDYFKEIITGDEVVKGKPDPEIYLTTAQKLGIVPSECLVLEDSANGVKSGKAAGMTVYGVNINERLRQELKDAGADQIFSNIMEINL